jgi:proteasome-associated ATPase
MTSAKLRKMLSDGELPPGDEKQVLELLASTEPESLLLMCQVFVNQRHLARQQLEKANKACTKAEAALEKLRQPPWIPATVVAVGEGGRLDVFGANRRQIVTALPEVQTDALRCGDEVYLDHELSLVVGRGQASLRSGLVGTVSEVADGRVLMRGPGDEEMTAFCDPERLESLEPGDRVLYTREVPCVIERLPERRQSRHVLETPMPTRFDQIGGHEELLAEIKRDLDLSLIHREEVADYHLKPLRGITFVGAPGVGKTMIAGAISHYVSEARPDTKFLHIKPGALRGCYYGESERSIRELFALIKSAPAIDGRVLGALLAEIDGLESADNLMCIGATNRIDLCDPALVRQQRFGDRIYELPRPGREATRRILEIYLTPDLPVANGANGANGEGGHDGEDGERVCAGLIDALTSYLHAPRGSSGNLATATLANSDQHEVTASEVLSGALLASAVEKAKRVAAMRRGRRRDRARGPDRRAGRGPGGGGRQAELAARGPADARLPARRRDRADGDPARVEDGPPAHRARGLERGARPPAGRRGKPGENERGNRREKGGSMEQLRRRRREQPQREIPRGGTPGSEEEPESDATGVQVIWGAMAQQMELAGMTVGEAQQLLRPAFGLAPEATPLVDGRLAGSGDRLASGQVLEFVRAAGEKGAVS